MSQQYVRSLLASLPVGTEIKDGALGQINATNAGEIAVYRNGAWELLARTGTGTVTLAGDVTGVSSANVVEKITGVGGVVDMKGTDIAWRATASTMTLSQIDQTTNNPAASFLVSLSAPFASATGANRNAPSGWFYIPAPVGAGTAGRWRFDVSGAEVFAVEATRLYVTAAEIRSATSITVKPVDVAGAGSGALFAAGDSSGAVGGVAKLYGGGGVTPGSVDIRASSSSGGISVTSTAVTVGLSLLQFGLSVSAPVIGQATIAGTPSTLTVQSQSSSTTKGGNLSHVTGAGSGGSNGDMTFSTGARPVMTFFDASNPIVHLYSPTIRYDENISAPGILIAPRTGNVSTHDFTCTMQAPFASATGSNRDAPSFIVDIPSPAAGGASGSFDVVISASNRMVVNTSRVELSVPSVRWENIGVGFTIEQVASATDGSLCRIIAQEGLTGDGGNLELIGGIANAAIRGGIALVVGGDVSDPGGIYMVEVRHVSSQFVTAIGSIAGITATDFPAGIANPSVYVGNAPSGTVGAGFPLNGFAMYSDDGRPAFKTATGAGAVGERMFTLDGELTVAGGALDRYFVIYIDDTRYKIPIHLDS
jgi:hypothetical protein